MAIASKKRMVDHIIFFFKYHVFVKHMVRTGYFINAMGWKDNERSANFKIREDVEDYIICQTLSLQTIYFAYKHNFKTNVPKWITCLVECLKVWRENGWSSSFDMIHPNMVQKAECFALFKTEPFEIKMNNKSLLDKTTSNSDGDIDWRRNRNKLGIQKEGNRVSTCKFHSASENRDKKSSQGTN